MSTTTRLACLLVALSLGACGPASTHELTLAEVIASDPLPLAKGAKWTYEVTVKRFDPDANKELTKTLSWTTEVVDAREANGVTAYRVRGWPSDLASLESGDALPTPSEKTVLRSGNSFLFGATADPTLDGSEGWFTWPLMDGQKICPRADMVYCWQVTAADKGGDYALSFFTGPDEQTFELQPNTGIARYHYAHHGTTNEVEAKLVTYTKGK